MRYLIISILYTFFSLNNVFGNEETLIQITPCMLQVLDYDAAVKKIEPLLLPYTWPSTSIVDGTPLSAEPMKDLARAVAVARFAATSDQVATELSQQLSTDPKLRTAAFFNLYSRAYDRAVLYADGYRRLVAIVSYYASLLSTSNMGRNLDVLDMGAGTGNFSFLLSWEHPEWFYSLVDFSKDSLKLAREKMEAARIGAHIARPNYRTLLCDLRKDVNLGPNSRFTAESQDVIILNSVIYNFPPDEKREILLSLKKILRPGGLLFLGEPLPEFQIDPGKKFELYKAIAESAINHGSPLNDYDTSLLAGLNRFLIEDSPRFQTFEEQGALGTGVGLTEIARGKPYYNSAGFWVFRKPR